MREDEHDSALGWNRYRGPECNVHFNGAAEDFVQESEGGRGTPTWVVVVAVVLLVVMVLGVFAGR